MTLFWRPQKKKEFQELNGRKLSKPWKCGNNVLMPLGWGEGTSFSFHEWKEKIISQRVTKAHSDFPQVTSGEAISDEWGIRMGLE